MIPSFDPSAWHACSPDDFEDCTQNANCYSYVLQRPDYYWSVPGMGYAHASPRVFFPAFDEYFSQATAADFRKQLMRGAERDGLIPVSSPAKREGYYLTALFFNDDPEDFDFHWYRQDSDGTWSSKDGWHAPTNRNTAGRPIHDPRDMPDPAYPLFGGFFLVPESGVVLQPEFPVA